MTAVKGGEALQRALLFVLGRVDTPIFCGSESMWFM